MIQMALMWGERSVEVASNLLRSDWMVNCILFLCLLVIPIVYVKSKDRLFKNLGLGALSRERTPMVDGVTTSDVRYTFLLVFHSCLMSAFVAYYCFSQFIPSILLTLSPILLLGGTTICFLLFFLAKWVIYIFVNHVFFQKERILAWTITFVNVFVCLGLLLFPLVLLMVFSDVLARFMVLVVVGILFLAKFTLFWKCFSIFFEKKYGFFHLILYFCALEILPDLILWKGIVFANNNLILNI